MGVRSCSVKNRFASSHFRRCEDSRGALLSWEGLRKEARREVEGERRLPALKCVFAMVTSFAELGWSGDVGEVGGEVCEGFLRMPVGVSGGSLPRGKERWMGGEVYVPLGRLGGGLPVVLAAFDAMVSKSSVSSGIRATKL